MREDIVFGTISEDEAAKQLMTYKEKQLNTVLNLDTSDNKVKSDGKRYWIYIGRKAAKEYMCKDQIYAQSRDELINRLYSIFFNPTDPLLKDAFEEWALYKYEVENRESKTIREYRNEWNRFFKDSKIAEMRLSSITVDDLAEVFFAMTKGHAIDRKRFVSAKSVLNGIFIHYKRYLHYNPVDEFEESRLKGHFKSGGENLDNYFDEASIQKMIDIVKDSSDPYDLAIAFASCVALRIGEVRAIKYSDYNPITHTLKIVRSARVENEISTDADGHIIVGKKYHVTEPRLKGNLQSSKRAIPLPKDAEEIIEKAHELFPDGEYLFTYKGKQLSPDTFNNHMKSACKKAEVPYHSSHKLRFFNARRLYNLVGLEKASLILGHSSTAQTLQYIKQAGISEADVALIREQMNWKKTG